MAEGGLTLVFDEHFSPKVIEFVARESSGTHDVRLIHVRQRGWSGKPDFEWMPQAIQEGFVIVSADRNEKTRAITNEDLGRLGARVLLLGPFWDHRTRWEKAKWLVAQLDRLIATMNTMTLGEVLLIGSGGPSGNA